MGYSIRLVDMYGEDTDLDVSYSFMDEVLSKSPTLRRLFIEYDIKASDGKVIPLYAIYENIHNLKEEINKILDKEIKNYLKQLIKFVEENYSVEENLGLAFW